MRFRSLVLILVAVGAAVVLLRRRPPSKFVDVHFDDGSTIRLTRGPEARDLLDDADAILETIA
jgi:hypothetical protein